MNHVAEHGVMKTTPPTDSVNLPRKRTLWTRRWDTAEAPSWLRKRRAAAGPSPPGGRLVAVPRPSLPAPHPLRHILSPNAVAWLWENANEWLTCCSVDGPPPPSFTPGAQSLLMHDRMDEDHRAVLNGHFPRPRTRPGANAHPALRTPHGDFHGLRLWPNVQNLETFKGKEEDRNERNRRGALTRPPMPPDPPHEVDSGLHTP